MTLNKIVATATVLVACALFVAACTSQSANPFGPTGVAGNSLRLDGDVGEQICNDGLDNDGDKAIDCADADCAEDPACKTPPPPGEACADGIDNDGDKAVDCADTDCAEDPACKTPPPPEGIPCSPGYWKNHISDFNASCGAAAALPGDSFNSCGDLWVAITCNGGPRTGCTGERRQAAATALNTVSGCTE